MNKKTTTTTLNLVVFLFLFLTSHYSSKVTDPDLSLSATRFKLSGSDDTGIPGLQELLLLLAPTWQHTD